MFVSNANRIMELLYYAGEDPQEGICFVDITADLGLNALQISSAIANIRGRLKRAGFPAGLTHFENPLEKDPNRRDQYVLSRNAARWVRTTLGRKYRHGLDCTIQAATAAEGVMV